MSNPWKEQAAFAPMFCDVVKVNGVRGNNKSFQATVEACLFPEQVIDPFDASSAKSNMKSITVIVPKDQQIATCKIQIGDTITLEDMSKWNANSVDVVDAYWRIEARSI